MDFITNSVENLNWWAVLVATLSAMPVGYLWYDLKLGFGKTWARLNRLKEKDLANPEGMGKTFGIMLLTAFLTAIVLGCLIYALDITEFWDSVLFGVVVGLVFRGGAHFVHNGYLKRPDTLTFIDAGHDTVALAVMAVILAVWR